LKSLRVKIVTGNESVDRVAQIPLEGTYCDLLIALGINPETVVVMVDGVPVPEDDLVQPGEVTIIRTVSAG
jgi:sulfur carrier protein